MLSPLKLQICQVIETEDKTQYDKYQDADNDDKDHPPGTIRIQKMHQRYGHYQQIQHY